MKYKNYTGIILAGGESSRMGEEKGFLKIGVKTYTELLIETLQNYFDDVIIISNDSEYEQFGVPIYQDVVKDKGPLAGILTGLKHSNTDYNFFTPCDSPYLEGKLIEKLINKVDNYDAIIPTYENKVFPLTAIYNKNCISQLEDALDNNRLKVKLEIERLYHHFVKFDNDYEKSFINFNTPEDILKYTF